MAFAIGFLFVYWLSNLLKVQKKELLTLVNSPMKSIYR